MADFWQDNLDDTDAVTLDLHTPTSGGTWNKHANWNSDLAFLSNEVYNKTAHGGQIACYTHSAAPSGADQQVTMSWHCLTSVASIGAILRTNHFIYYDGTNWNIFVLGTGSPPGSQAADAGRFSAGNTYTVVIKEVGNVVTATVNGTQVYSFTITGGYIVSTAGFSGIGSFNITTSTTGFRIVSASSQGVTVAATSYQITGPAVCCTGITTPASTGLRGAVAGPFIVAFTPSGGVLATDFTFSLSDGGAGTFSATPKIVAGQTTANFTYTPAAAGSKTITATETSANGFGAKTCATVVTSDAIIVDGNSISDNVSGTLGTGISWPVTLQTLVGTAYAVFDFAVAGTRTVDQTSGYTANVHPTVAAIAGNKYLFFLEIGNDVDLTNPSPTAAQGLAHLQSYTALAVADSCKVILMTATPRVAGSLTLLDGVINGTGFNTRVRDINALVRSSWGSIGASGIIDCVADTRLQDPSVTTYFTDGTHPTAALMTIFATEAVASVAQTAGGPSGGSSSSSGSGPGASIGTWWGGIG